MLEREEGFEKGVEKESERKSREFVTNLLRADKFTISEIANYASVNEAFVEKVKTELHL